MLNDEAIVAGNPFFDKLTTFTISQFIFVFVILFFHVDLQNEKSKNVMKQMVLKFHKKEFSEKQFGLSRLNM